jgi:threonine dehydratase
MVWVAEAARTSGQIEIQAYNADRIIAATGAIGLEILEDDPDVREILVPISGGGLISGIATAVKAVRPSVRIIGVEPVLANDAELSFRAGRRIGISPEDAARTGADGLRVPILGDLTWPHIQHFVDDIVSVEELEIDGAARWIVDATRMLVERSGATATAASLRHAERRGMVAVLSGGNVDPSDLSFLGLGQG